MSDFTPQEKQLLLNAVDSAIKFGLEKHQVLQIKLEDYPEKLLGLGASFVTLEINQELRGCIGSLEAQQPLIQDVVHNAYAAAFRDPRFYPLTTEEYPNTTKHISVLSKPQPMSFTSEKDLLNQLRPGTDGLTLSDQGYRGTFLPAVWESLVAPELFLRHLKLKAGLPENYWSGTIKIEKYTAEVIE
jgi:AmmeMemoRadiSam system protein A